MRGRDDAGKGRLEITIATLQYSTVYNVLLRRCTRRFRVPEEEAAPCRGPSPFPIIPTQGRLAPLSGATLQRSVASAPGCGGAHMLT